MITYCFKFHPPFLSPEVLSVCRLSLSIVNLLAVPLLSAASALAVHVRSAGLMPTAKGLSAAATLAVHVRNRFALPDSRAFALSVFLTPTAKGPKNLRFSGPAGAFTCIGSVCRCKHLHPLRCMLTFAFAYIIPHAGRFSNRYSLLFAANLMLIFQ